MSCIQNCDFDWSNNVIWWICIISPYAVPYPFGQSLCIPCFLPDIYWNCNLFTVSWLLVYFIIFFIIVASTELYIRPYKLFVRPFGGSTLLVFCFVCIAQKFDCWFLFGLFFYFLALEACMYVCPLTIGFNLYTGCLSLYDFLTLKDVDYVSLISFTTVIYMSSWYYWIGTYCSLLNGM